MKENQKEKGGDLGSQRRNWDLRSANGFGEFYDFWAPRIWRHALIRTSSREEAEDITAKSFLRVWEYVRAGKRIKSASAFLYKVTTHLLIDYYRSRSANPTVALLQNPKDDPMPESGVLLEDIVVKRYDAKLVRTALQKLKPNDQAILTMRFVDDLSIEEISGALGKSRGAVSVAIHRALKELEKIIEKDYGKVV